MNWKEQFIQEFGIDEESSNGLLVPHEQIDFIEEQIIGKLMEDIPDDIGFISQSIERKPERQIIPLKQYLKDKWL